MGLRLPVPATMAAWNTTVQDVTVQDVTAGNITAGDRTAAMAPCTRRTTGGPGPMWWGWTG